MTFAKEAWPFALPFAFLAAVLFVLGHPGWAVAAPALAVEKAMKMSPDPLLETLPVRPSPSAARRAMRFSWWGSSGASVATTMMIEPSSPIASCSRAAASAARAAHLPYPIVLVLGGIVLGVVPGLPEARLNPDLVLVIFLPPLARRQEWQWHKVVATASPLTR